MFTLAELEEDPSLLLDLKEDVREECATLGDVTNVVLYDVSELPLFLLSSVPRVVAHRFVFSFVPVARARGYHDGQVP
jgi:hypothetical protein